MSLSTDLLDSLSPENKIFVAFSGGLDSTALLFLCNKALKEEFQKHHLYDELIKSDHFHLEGFQKLYIFPALPVTQY